MAFKPIDSAPTTITRDADKIDASTGNLYKSIAIVAKRANQIGVAMKEEMDKKLEEFSSYSDSLDEVFDNREQIEISRYYEKLPKPSSMALQEFMDGKLFFRSPETEQKNN